MKVYPQNFHYRKTFKFCEVTSQTPSWNFSISYTLMFYTIVLDFHFILRRCYHPIWVSGIKRCLSLSYDNPLTWKSWNLTTIYVVSQAHIFPVGMLTVFKALFKCPDLSGAHRWWECSLFSLQCRLWVPAAWKLPVAPKQAGLLFVIGWVVNPQLSHEAFNVLCFPEM